MDNTVSHQNRYTAEEYFKLTADREDRTELIDGEIVALAQPGIVHQQISARLHAAVDHHIRKNNGKCTVLLAVEVKLLDDTVVVPDVLVMCDPSKMDDKRCYGAPDWAVEILSSNSKNDLIRKLMLYKQNGVREYWIINPEMRITLVYFFEKNDFPNIYTFDTPIPVEIYNRELAIRIADLV